MPAAPLGGASLNAHAPPPGDITALPPALSAMVAQPRWLVWRWEDGKNGRRTKVPYRATSPEEKASSTDSRTWSDYVKARDAVLSGQADGIGYALHGGDVAAFDLDDAIAEDGSILTWAWDLIDECDSYTERTISGTGLRILGKAAGGKVHRKQKVPGTPSSLETYRVAERYIVITGAALDGFGGDLRNIDAAIDAWVPRLDEAAKAERERVRQEKAAAKAAERAKAKPRTAGERLAEHVERVRVYDPTELPRELDELIRYGVPEGQRSEKFFHVVGWLKDRGLSVGEIEALLASHPGGIAEKFIDRLRPEVERAFDKAETKSGPLGGSAAEDDGFGPSAAPKAERKAAEPMKFTATPFRWRDPKTFPRRRWLYGYHLIRKFISCTVSPGGLGKTSLVLVEAVALATGRPLLGVQSPEGPLTVWVLNLEDPQEEIERRVTAILMHYRIDPAEIEGRLYLDSGRHLKLVVAELQKGGTIIVRPTVEAFAAEIQARAVDVVVVDPFVKSHRVPENDNGAIDMVATVFADIADACNCAFDLIHHVRKTGGGEITVEDGRGAVALLGAVRSARVLNGMSKDEAAKLGDDTNPREFFRVSNGKLNMAPPPPDRAEWFRLLSVPLGNGDETFGPNPLPFDNGDHVQCVASFEWPDMMETVTVAHLRATQTLVAAGEWREAVQAKERWVGAAVAQAMKLDHANKGHRAIINAALSNWYASGMLVKVRRKDKNHEERTFVEVGERATD